MGWGGGGRSGVRTRTLRRYYPLQELNQGQVPGQAVMLNQNTAGTHQRFTIFQRGLRIAASLLHAHGSGRWRGQYPHHRHTPYSLITVFHVGEVNVDSLPGRMINQAYPALCAKPVHRWPC